MFLLTRGKYVVAFVTWRTLVSCALTVRRVCCAAHTRVPRNSPLDLLQYALFEALEARLSVFLVCAWWSLPRAVTRSSRCASEFRSRISTLIALNSVGFSFSLCFCVGLYLSLVAYVSSLSMNQAFYFNIFFCLRPCHLSNRNEKMPKR